MTMTLDEDIQGRRDDERSTKHKTGCSTHLLARRRTGDAGQHHTLLLVQPGNRYQQAKVMALDGYVPPTGMQSKHPYMAGTTEIIGKEVANVDFFRYSI